MPPLSNFGIDRNKRKKKMYNQNRKKNRKMCGGQEKRSDKLYTIFLIKTIKISWPSCIYLYKVVCNKILGRGKNCRLSLKR